MVKQLFRCWRKHWLIVAGIFALMTAGAAAQAESLPPASAAVYDVFVTALDDDKTAALTFLDSLSGEATTLRLSGERFTLLGDGVLYFDAATATVRYATPAGAIGEHDFIRANADAERVDWVISRDGERVAWTLTRRTEDGMLVTSTVVANADGSDLRGVLLDGPRAGIRALPAGFGKAGGELYLDMHPAGLGAALPYRRHAGLVALDLDEGGMRLAGGGEACYCPVGFGDRVMLRVMPNMALEVVNLADGQGKVIERVELEGYEMAGAPLISDDDQLAVYAISTIDENAGYLTRFALVDLAESSQEVLGEPASGLAYPQVFTEDKSALLFLRDSEPYTWKLRLADGAMARVAAGLYLGRLGG